MTIEVDEENPVRQRLEGLVVGSWRAISDGLEAAAKAEEAETRGDYRSARYLYNLSVHRFQYGVGALAAMRDSVDAVSRFVPDPVLATVVHDLDFLLEMVESVEIDAD